MAAGALPLLAQPSAMTVPQAALLGAVEGLTEFLPVSSTGHLLIVQRLLGTSGSESEKSASDAYAIVIQLGAILAVLLVSLRRVQGMLRGLLGRDPTGLRLAGHLLLAFVPAAAVGLLFEDGLKRYLFYPWPIAGALAVGGLFVLVTMRRKGSEGGKPVEALTWQTALIIGLAQVLALWPGVSRSLATMATGLLVGLSVPAAVEFSFLLGLVTLGSATVYEGVRYGPQIVALFGWLNPLVGFVSAMVTGFVAVRWMLGYLTRHSLAIFGWYRIGVAAVLATLIGLGVL
jgi:undecaprenyl-diphosphatase